MEKPDNGFLFAGVHLNGNELNKINNNGFDRVNAGLAAFVFLFTFIIYYLTMAPTFSFWDCGEFVACSYILGIPHPPGSPLYILLGRLFTILPIAADYCVRVNLLSVFTSSIGATLGYLVTIRLMRFWYKNRHSLQDRIIIYIGGLTGSLFMAFGSTNWANSVEAEVYAPTIMFMLAMFWLALKYYENQESPAGSRYMVLVAYLALLGVGIHLTLFALIPVVSLFFIFNKEATSRHWAIISSFFLVELYLIFHLSSRPGEVAYYLPVMIIFILFLFHAVFLNLLSKTTKITLGLFLLALYPLYFLILEALSLAILKAPLANTFVSLAQLPLGWIGFASLTFWGIFCAFKYYVNQTDEKASSEYLIPSLYALTPAFLFILGTVFSGYMAFLFVTTLLLVLVAVLLGRQVNWLIMIAIGSVSMIILGFWQFIWGVGLGSAAIIILGIVLKDKSWKTALAIILLAVIGFSVHTFIPIRSAHQPIINENNPSKSFGTFINYLERKQYGSQSMVDRMFVRRAEWQNQFGDYRRMGFWHFFKEQFGVSGGRFFIILILGLFGIWETIRRKPDVGLPFFIIIIICTIGLVLYMNFADGTRRHPVTGGDYLEVRNRDYFFTPGFVFFGLAIGLGIAAFVDLVRDSFKSFSPNIRNAAFGFSSLLVLMPIIPLSHNYFINDRSKNYMPYDYAANYLRSCKENAILITNGDNDTFPTWCIQEVYGFRKDVRIVNLSLANTAWYIIQLRDNLNLPINMTNEQIEALRPHRTTDGRQVRIQDQLSDIILTGNKWRDPVYMAVTVSEESRSYRGQSLLEYLELEGLVYRLTTDKGGERINYELTSDLYEGQFIYRGTGDTTIFKNESTARLINNYAQGFLFLADTMRRTGEYEMAFEHIRNGLKVLPRSYDIYAYYAQLLGEMGRLDTLESFVENAPIANKKQLYYNWGMSANYSGRFDDAVLVLGKALEKDPDYSNAFRALVRILYQNKMYGQLRDIVGKWVVRHPEDRESAELLRQIDQIETTVDTVEGRK